MMANGRGGRRPGAGRKLGSASLKTREIANAAAATGITPLEVMLEAMRKHRAAGDLDAAAAVAKDAAPYIHPRLASVALDATVHRDPVELTTEELMQIAAGGRTGGAGPGLGEDEPDQSH